LPLAVSTFSRALLTLLLAHQVNYLIYPGTSGASFMDYVVGDKWVTPPEHQSHFVEKMALLPNCYQINVYGRHLCVHPDP
jgi:predicted O-linked N-acetylglucosamine transferase (SPINDLY family)